MKNRAAIFLLIFGFFWSALTLLFDGFIFVPAVRQLTALRYASTEGTIVSSEVTHHDGDEGPTHGVSVRYTYVVGDQEFTGERYRYGDWNSSDSKWAYELVRSWAPGTRVRVFYNPEQPRDAILQTGLTGSDLFLFMFITPFNGAMLGFWWAGLSHLRCSWFKPAAGGAKIISGPRDTRVRLTAFSPAVVGLASLALAAFAGIFVVGFLGGGFNPPLRVMQVAWPVIIGIGVAGGVWRSIQVRSGKYDLIIDAQGNAFELPLIQGRKEPRRVPFRDIQSISVETQIKPSSDGDRSTRLYVPTLHLQGSVSSAERLSEWYVEANAKAFVSWLQEQVHLKSSTPFEETEPRHD